APASSDNLARQEPREQCVARLEPRNKDINPHRVQETVTMIWPAIEEFDTYSHVAQVSADCRKSKWSMPTERYMLWIDGVGAWQLCVGAQFLIGGPTLEDTSADICLMANLSRRHASLLRNGEDWFIHPHQSTVVSGRAVSGSTLLRTGDEICLAERVRLGFRIPSVLAGSALIDFESHHRPARSVNGIILMTDSILLGPRKDHHVCCPDWPEMVVIYRQDDGLRCRSKAALTVDGTRVRDSALLTDGAIVSGDDFRFRIEKLKT
ncbi:MAG TPA: FHA domain-containing protein, partial [Planctomycetaceae bacterium]|nr:FHA domain-containing protein [Planctomycetaceae bacterium]HQZ67913.1 FHA domain-containing protein [Planctomycetaceae bacterium]HRA89387.1 FHA domain-containing protein [Planctomycetaceae bacterium]